MLLVLLGSPALASPEASAPPAAPRVSAMERNPDASAKPAKKKISTRTKATGETGKQLEAKRREKPSSGFTRWKRRLPFWPRKGLLLLELSLFIALGVVLAQILEVSGIVRYLAIIAWPLIRLGRLEKEAGPALLMAFQSGAIANSMLISSRNDGSINNRQLYTSVLVVSCLSLFAHLPTYVLPIGSVFGVQATAALFAVRFSAIFAEIILVLVVSNFLVRPWLAKRNKAESKISPEQIQAAAEAKARGEKRLARKGGFWKTVWARSHKTLRRLLLFLIPTYAVMAGLEYFGFFQWLTETLPSLFQMSFLPSQSTAIIPAQAISLYNGAIVAANFLDDGVITVQQAVLIILVGSMVTAPIRTFKHALPTYIAVLGPRAGLVLAISAQLLRVMFLALSTAVLWMIWNP